MRRQYTVSFVVALAFVTPASIALSPAVAFAETPKKAAKAHHDSGVKLYNLGRFDEAIAEFEKAYELDPHPILLFNIAQAHRQRGDAERAIFFYRRYQQMAPDAPDRDEVNGRIRDLEEIVARQRSVKEQPPDSVKAAPKESETPSGAAPTPTAAVVHDEARSEPESAAPAPSAHRLRLSAEGGIGVPVLSGTADLSAPTLLTTRLGGTYDLTEGALPIALGAAVSWSPLSYTEVGGTTKHSSSLLGASLTAGLRHALTDRFTVGAQVDACVVWWTGLDAGNPFTRGAVGANGPIAMPSGRFAALATWLIGDRYFVGVSPAATVSKTTGDALTENVSWFSRFELNLVAGAAL